MKLQIDRENIENIQVGSLLIIAVIVFFYFILGLQGALSALGIMVFFVLPFYFLLGKFNLREDEKLAFSFFIGAGIFPAIAYWLGIFISFRLSIFITFIILIAAAYFLNRIKKKIS
ncbi:hypothetical protein HYU09_04865 [Candidatus Woesearchaeota archaeon]|nr:hypothetical protein [Candidatus Woesearchaeota archaeon]